MWVSSAKVLAANQSGADIQRDEAAARGLWEAQFFPVIRL